MGTNYYHGSSNGFAVILDIHFGKKCNIRLDNTEDVIEEKIDQIIDYCLENNVKVVFIAGDVFDNCSIGRKEFVKAHRILNKFKEEDINLVTIFGNHDEYRYNPEYRKETPLRDLENMGIIKVLGSDDQYEILDDQNNTYFIYGFPYVDTEILKEQKYKDTGDRTKIVVLAHTFFDNEFMGGENNLTKEDIQRINADYYILGHDHSYYEPTKVNNKYVFRFGSLVRGTSSKNDLQREVMFMHFHDNEWEEVHLETKKLEEVTIAKATVKEEKIDYKEIIEEIKITEDDKIDVVMDAINKIENKDVKEIIRRNINEI